MSLHHNHLVAPRASVPGIANISGPHATATMTAWVKIGAQQGDGGFIGGVWDESHAWRQFALFVDLAVCGHIPNGTVAHISGAGGPEAGRQYCQSAACGTTNLGDGKWHCIANVYNSTDILAYVDGELDNRGDPEGGPRHNPFKCVVAVLSVPTPSTQHHSRPVSEQAVNGVVSMVLAHSRLLQRT